MQNRRLDARRRALVRPARCGSLRVRMVTEAVVLKIRGTSYRFEDVPHERCTACGERVFGIDASRMFDGIVRGNRRTRAA